jgi:hypothetical protein
VMLSVMVGMPFVLLLPSGDKLTECRSLGL